MCGGDYGVSCTVAMHVRTDYNYYTTYTFMPVRWFYPWPFEQRSATKPRRCFFPSEQWPSGGYSMYTWCVCYNNIIYTGWMKPGQPCMEGGLQMG